MNHCIEGSGIESPGSTSPDTKSAFFRLLWPLNPNDRIRDRSGPGDRDPAWTVEKAADDTPAAL